MTRLTGTEKQVMWAEDIRKEWQERVEILKDDALIIDYTEVRVTKDPLSGTEKTTEVKGTRVDPKMQSALTKSARCFEEDFTAKTLASYKIKSSLVEKIEKALEEKTEATFWINFR